MSYVTLWFVTSLKRAEASITVNGFFAYHAETVSQSIERTIMSTAPTRTEHDSLGDLEVPVDAYYGVQTMRAIHNFPISGQPMPRARSFTHT